MFWLVFVLSIGAVLLLMLLINQGAVSKVASLFYLVPGVTALMAYALFGETLTLFQLVGMFIATPRRRPLDRSETRGRLDFPIADDRGIDFRADDEDRRDDIEKNDRRHDRGETRIGRHIGCEGFEIAWQRS